MKFQYTFPGQVLFVLLSVCLTAATAAAAPPEPIRIGWLGAMTGPVSKYASYEGATLAMEDINAAGGIAGRPLEISFHDGKCQVKDAIDSANALLEREHVRFIVGGHCSTESLAIAPLVQRSSALMIAASSSSPKLTASGENIFRLTAPYTKGVELLISHLKQQATFSKFAIVYEETEYAQGVAEYFEKLLPEIKGEAVSRHSFKMGDGDFLSALTRIKHSGAQALLLSVQSPDAAVLFLTKAQQQGVQLPTFGNEIAGNSVQSAKAESVKYFDNLVFPEPSLDPSNPMVQAFLQRYKTRFKVDHLPNGFWSMEAYDAVRVLADTIARCGREVEAVKKCLLATKNYQGVTGSIGFDENGDGVRTFVLKVIRAGKIVRLADS